MQHGFHFLNRIRRLAAVQNGVAIGANGAQVSGGIEGVVDGIRNRQLVELNVRIGKLTVPFRKVKTANGATLSVFVGANLAGVRIFFVSR